MYINYARVYTIISNEFMKETTKWTAFVIKFHTTNEILVFVCDFDL